MLVNVRFGTNATLTPLNSHRFLPITGERIEFQAKFLAISKIAVFQIGHQTVILLE
jgi:hypothetical protein